MRSVTDGGGGMTRDQAGHVFGLTSESGCKNALRLLQLPDSIKQLIIAGEIPERAARALVPYAAAPAVMNAIAEELASPDKFEFLAHLASGEQPWAIDQAISEYTRPISSDLNFQHPYPAGAQPCLFDWGRHESELQIVDLPAIVGFDSKTRPDKIESRRFALNTKLWDKLQSPLLRDAEEARKKRNGSTTKGAATAASDKKPTPAQVKVEEKRRAAEADRRLDTFTLDWTQRLLRCAIAGRSHEDDLVAKTIGWLTSCCMCGMGVSLRYHADAALAECQLPMPKGHGMVDQLAVIGKLPKKLSAESAQKPFDLLNAYWRLILWPVTTLIGDGASKSRMTPAGELPDRLIGINAGEVFSLAAIAGVSVETAWKAGATESSDERRLIAVWLCRHTKAQLHKLRLELNVTEGSETMGRDELADCVLNAHRPGQPLPLPKRVVRVGK